MKPPEKILVFRQSSLGDVILALPVIAELARAFPGASIDFLTKTQYAPIVKFDPAVKNILVFQDNAGFRRLLKQVRSRKYDLILDLQRNLRSVLLTFSSPASRTVRYKKRRLAREMIVRKPSLRLSVDHTVNAYFHTLRRLGLDCRPAPPRITLPPETAKSADEFINRSFGNAPGILIALCPGARHYEKKWPHEKYRETAEILLEEMPAGILVISASMDSIPADLGLGNPRVVAVRDSEILHIAALLSRCNVALTNDSGLMHLANAAGTRTAAIFGPTSPRLGFSPTLPGSAIISNHVFCSPCSLHGEKPCRQSRKYCFENITARQVADTVLNMLGR